VTLAKRFPDGPRCATSAAPSPVLDGQSFWRVGMTPPYRLLRSASRPHRVRDPGGERAIPSGGPARPGAPASTSPRSRKSLAPGRIRYDGRD
jgi:hypothetical protein